MRRGLIQWDADELPIAVLQKRAGRLRSAMAEAGVDVVILYTNFIRCAAVSWLTGFSPYWADGILVVARDGEPMFATTLSKRMGSWIESVMPGASVVTSANPGQLAGKRLVEAGAKRIGILELNDFPAGLYTDISAALPDAAFADASEIFAQARVPADDAECNLLRHSDRIAQTALASIDAGVPKTAGEAAGWIEKSARMDGAEEVYVAIARNLDESRSFLRVSGDHPLSRRFAVRATVAYKGCWVRRIRTFSRNSQDLSALRRADDWFSELLATFTPASPGDSITEAIARLTEATLDGWFAEATAGTRPLRVIASHENPGPCRAPALVLAMNLRLGGMPWCGAALVHPE